MQTKILGTIALMLMASTVAAAPSTFRNGVAGKQAAFADPAKSFTVLVREAGPGRDSVLNHVLDRFASSSHGIKTGSLTSIDTGTETSLASGAGWALEVGGDGDVVRYRNLDAFDNAGPGVPLGSRISDERAQELARAFVNDALAGVVTLGEKERLEPWYVALGLTVGGAAVDVPTEPERRVQAVKVVLTRVVDDVPVLGNGSKITVFLDAGGSAIGFDLNWARYRRTKESQRSVGRAEADSRVAMLANAKRRSGQVLMDATVECGYYDPGMLATGASLQLACVHSYSLAVPKSGLSPKTAWMDAVPIGAQVRREARWPESALFAPPP